MIDTIKAHAPHGLIDFGAGNGYLSFILRAHGIPTEAIDKRSIEANFYWSRTRGGGGVADPEHLFTWVPLTKSSSVSLNPDKALLLSWPPLDDEMATSALQQYRGDTVIYLGQHRGGCCADHDFFDTLDAEWGIVNGTEYPRFAGLHDYCTVWRRDKRRS